MGVLKMQPKIILLLHNDVKIKGVTNVISALFDKIIPLRPLKKLKHDSLALK